MSRLAAIYRPQFLRPDWYEPVARILWVGRGYLVTMLAAAAAEIAVATSFVVGHLPLAIWVVAHIVIIALLWRPSLRAARSGVGAVHRVGPLFLIATAALGPVGSLGALLTAVLLRFWASRVDGFDLWYPAALTDVEQDLSSRLYRRVVRPAHARVTRCSVAPFVDIISNGTATQKRAVVALIANRFQPVFAPALLAALKDDDAAVRVLAASATARIESGFLKTLLELENRHASEPTDADVKWALARHCDHYANTGLLDEERAFSARQRALELFRECEAVGHKPAEALRARVRLLVRLGRDEEVIETLAPPVAQGATPAVTFAWYLECLFRRRCYTALREACRAVETQPAALTHVSERCRAAVKLWSSGTPPF
jgi:polysaccharide biosynthesis protein PelE